MMNVPSSIFFLGKGGVGKSTSSALYALFLARRGFRVRVVSMDPAHNLADIFRTKLSDRPRSIVDGLTAMEVDQDRWVNSYLSDINRQLKSSYSYLSAFNLEGHFDIIRYSPGLEEYALILAYRTIQEDSRSQDVLIFDMAPTALSLKFFALPSLSLIWINKLLDLRREIIRKREMITRIKGLRKERETDKILNTIEEQKKVFELLKAGFQQPGQTQVRLVLNPDVLSLAESRRIQQRLQELGITLDHIFLNKTRVDSDISTISTVFPDIAVTSLPQAETPLIGYESLIRYLDETAVPFPVVTKIQRDQ